MTATGNNAQCRPSHPLHVVLFQPEIPPNTGNIGRTCVALGAKLWMVRPTGFQLDSAKLRRAGMDYWKELDWELVDDWQHLEQRLPAVRFWLCTKFATASYHKTEFQAGDALVFGRESSGLPESLREKYASQQIRIPMAEKIRCLNLSTAAGIVAYEAARQLGLLDQPTPTMEFSLEESKLCD